MQQRSIVYEVRWNCRKVGHTQHRAIYSHSIPCHLRMWSRCSTKRNSRERSASVILHKDRRVECEHISHRQSYIFFQDKWVKHCFLHADIFHWALGLDFNFTKPYSSFRPVLLIFRLLWPENNRHAPHDSYSKNDPFRLFSHIFPFWLFPTKCSGNNPYIELVY